MKSSGMKQPHHQFKIVFYGDVEKVDVNVLISTLLNTTNVLNEISREVDPQHKLLIEIKPFEPGSFEILYSLATHGMIGDLIAHLTSADIIGHLADLITILTGVFAVKKLLKGKKPESTEEAGDKIKIVAGDGSSTLVDKRVYKIYGNNAVVNDGINKTFKALEDQDQIDEFKILSDRNDSLFEVARKEFPAMQEFNEMLKEDLEIITVPEARLILHKIVFTQDNKWSFIYEGNKISAFILDAIFFEKLGEHDFKIGDYFIAELRIIREYNPIFKAYINREYEVIKIKDHQKQAVQQKLAFHKK